MHVVKKEQKNMNKRGQSHLSQTKKKKTLVMIPVVCRRDLQEQACTATHTENNISSER